MDWQEVGALLAIGALVGGGLASALVSAYHRTRGARRNQAIQATKQALQVLRTDTLSAKEILKLQAELYVFYFKLIKATEGMLTRTQPADVIQEALPTMPKGGQQSESSSEDAT